jgi:hypothetical protein
MNKSKLLTSTALISAAVLMTGGSANALDVKVGGFYEAWVGWADNKKIQGVNNDTDVKTDGELYFRAEDTLPNGLKVGFLLEMEAGVGADGGSGPANTGRAGVGDSIWDEAFAWVKSKWGQVNIGNNDVAAAYVGGLSTVGPVGITKSDASDWLPGEYALNNSDVDLGSNDAGNITYFTPRVAGVQAIVSYSPDQSDWGIHEKDKQETTGVHNVWSGAVRFDQKFGWGAVGVGAGYTTLENTDVAGSTGAERSTGYNGKASVTFGPVKVDGVIAHENLAGTGHTASSNRTDEYYGVSAVFAIDKMNDVSVAYAHSTRRGLSATGGGDRNNSNLFTAGVSHELGKGIAVEASVFYAKLNGQAATDDNKGLGIVGGLSLKF